MYSNIVLQQFTNKTSKINHAIQIYQKPLISIQYFINDEQIAIPFIVDHKYIKFKQ